MAKEALEELTRRAERLEAEIRARVEHPFQVVKNRFGHGKVRYKGLKKDTAHRLSLFAPANLVIVKKRVLAYSFRFFTRSRNSHRLWPTPAERGSQPGSISASYSQGVSNRVSASSIIAGWSLLQKRSKLGNS